MAFKSIHSKANGKSKEDLPPLGEPVKAKELSKGKNVTGYFIGTSVKEGEFGKNYNALMEDPQSGECFMVYSVGSLKYDLMDGRLEKGLLTRITAEGQQERESKDGKKYKIYTFDVAQDPEDKLDLPEIKSSEAIKVENQNKVGDDIKKSLGTKK